MKGEHSILVRRAVLFGVPLLYVADVEAIVLIASNWGRRNHPAWALNLEEDPEARVTIDGVARRYRARRASAEERSRY